MSVDQRVTGALLMFESLNQTVSKAGGCEYTWEQLINMSASELIARLGCNGVRFCNEPKREPSYTLKNRGGGTF
jgi:hypothetical protein